MSYLYNVKFVCYNQSAFCFYQDRETEFLAHSRAHARVRGMKDRTTGRLKTSDKRSEEHT